MYNMATTGMMDMEVVAFDSLGRTVAGGLDALLSIAQMPKGVPVACMAVDGGENAGHFAARILGKN